MSKPKKHRSRARISKSVLRLESLEPRAMLSADSALFVESVYEKLLLREADEGGAEYWGGLLDNGVSREHVVKGVQGSEEFRSSALAVDCAALEASAQVEHFYYRFLGRAADDAGLDFWISKLDADGMNGVIAGILGSGESEQWIRSAKETESSSDDVTPVDSGVQALAGVPFVITPVEFSQISPSARLYAPQENPPYGVTSNSSATQQDAMTQALGYNFVVFYDQNNSLNLARRKVDNSNAWKVINLGNIVNTVDNHKTPNVGVSQNDGRIHLAYGHHAENLRYRMSIAGAATVADAQFTTANLFGGTAGAERNFLLSGQTLTNVTYPTFVTLEISKKLIFFWREGSSGDGDLMLSTYNDVTATWQNKIKVIDGQTGTYVDQSGSYSGSAGTSNDRNPYTNEIIVKGNDIHLTWTWRETATPPVAGGPRTNHDLMYAKSTDGGLTWTNAAGVTVGTSGTNSFKMNVNSDVRVTTVNGSPLVLDYDWDLINQNSSYVDSLGNTHVLLRHADASESATQRYWHYVRSGATWTRTMLPFASGTRPKMFIDRVTDTVYVTAVLNSPGVGPTLRLFAAQKGTDDWGTWNQIYQTGVVYRNDGPNGRISADGRTLWLVGQRAGAASDSTSSRIELIKFTLDPNV